MRKLCPACITRLNRVVHPECIVCDGNGYLALGLGALSLFSQNVVSQAVELCLESAARIADMHGTLSDDRAHGISSVIEKMQRAGLVLEEESPYLDKAWWANHKSAKQPRRDNGRFAPFLDAGELAEQTTQEPLVPLDMVLPEAAPYVYTEEERPNARGLPILSANGHPSHLARVADPQEPGRSTHHWVRERREDQRQANVLVEAANKAVATKQRRKNRTTATK